jgi:hypothetical protein
LLEVVEHQERRQSGKLITDSGNGGFANTERVSSGREHQVGIDQWGERCEPNHCEIATQVVRGLQGEAGFADPGRTDQGDEAHILFADQRGEILSFLLAAAEGGQGARQRRRPEFGRRAERSGKGLPEHPRRIGHGAAPR